MTSSSLKSFFAAGLAVAAAMPAAGQTFTTSFDGLTAGALNGQDNWATQSQWVADGSGAISNTNGAFTRAHNTSVVGSTDIGEVTTITTSLTLGAASAMPSNDVAPFETGVFQQGLSDQVGTPAFAFGIAAGLFVEGGELILRGAQGDETSGTSSASLGVASSLGDTDLVLITTYTKTAANTYSVVASAGGASISYIATAEADLDTDPDGDGIIGGFSALPSGGGTGGVATPAFAATTVTDFSFAVTPVPEPASLALVGLGCVALVARRRA